MFKGVAPTKIDKETAPIILNLELSYDNKRYIIFSLTEYMLSCIAKLVGVIFSYTSLDVNYYKALKEYLIDLTDYITQIIFEADCPAFQLDEIDLIMPLCYRYFKILEKQLEFLKNEKDINFRYDLVKFSKINMIYDKIDYCFYINNNCTETSTKTRILNIYERIKGVMEILSKTN